MKRELEFVRILTFFPTSKMQGEAMAESSGSGVTRLSGHIIIIMWGLSVIKLSKLKRKGLERLVGRLGVVQMKSLVRSFLWSPGLDQQTEVPAMRCSGCKHVLKMPTVAPFDPWECPVLPWRRIYVDFAGSFKGTLLWVMLIQSILFYSKPEVFTMKSKTFTLTIDVL